MTAKGKTPLIWPLLDKLNPTVARQQRPRSSPLGVVRLPTAPWDESDHPPPLAYGQVEGTPNLWETAAWNIGQASLGRQSAQLQNFKTNPRALRISEQARSPGVVHPVTLSALGPISATLAVTEAADTVAATSTVLVSTTASITEAADTVASTATVAVAATASITEAADSVAATSTVLVATTASITEAADSLVATATVLDTASEVSTEADDSVVATGTVSLSASAAITEAADSLTATAIADQPAGAVTVGTVGGTRGGGYNRHEVDRAFREYLKRKKRYDPQEIAPAAVSIAALVDYNATSATLSDTRPTVRNNDDEDAILALLLAA